MSGQPGWAILELAIGYALGFGGGYGVGYKDGQESTRFRQCPSTQSFAGGEDLWRCQLQSGHIGGHRGTNGGV